MNSGIYKITCLITGIIYIGSSVNLLNRRRGHFDKNEHNRYLTRALNKYGEKNFTWEILEYCEIEKLLKREQHYLNCLLSASENNDKFDKLGYNICRVAGSRLGVKASRKTREKMSKLLIERWKNNSYRDKLTKCHIGHVVSEETRIKISKNSARGKWFLNKNHTNEAKIKIGEASKKRKSADRVHIANLKPVVQYDLKNNPVKIWRSVVDVKKALNIQVGQVCLGKRISAGGFKWNYV